MIARLDVQKRGLEDAIMLDTQGFIAEGATNPFSWSRTDAC